MLKKVWINKGAAADVPDVRADEPERAMEQFSDGLRKVLSARKPQEKRRRHGGGKTLLKKI